jgi:hypothetical protein
LELNLLIIFLVSLANSSSVQFYTKLSATKFTFQAALPFVNYVFSSGGGGIIYQIKNPGDVGNDNLKITVNDLGNFGEEVPPVPKNATKTISIKYGPTEQTGGSGFVAVSLVGITSLLGAAATGIYKFMKKRKMIPESTDPWESAEVFQEGALYQGSTSSISTVEMLPQ